MLVCSHLFFYTAWKVWGEWRLLEAVVETERWYRNKSETRAEVKAWTAIQKDRCEQWLCGGEEDEWQRPTPEPPLWRAAVAPPHCPHLVTFSDAIYHTQRVMDIYAAHTRLLCVSTNTHLNTSRTGREQLHTVINANTNGRESKWAGDQARKTERESGKERATISSLGTYTDAAPILQQRVEPRVDREGRDWVCSYDFIILKWKEWPR